MRRLVRAATGAWMTVALSGGLPAAAVLAGANALHASPPVERTALEAPPADTAEAVVEGVVRGRIGSELRPLPGAMVELFGPGRLRTATAGPDGSYRIAGVPPGAGTLRVRSLGYASASFHVRVPEGEPLTLDVELEVRPVVLSAVHVDAAAPLRSESGAAGRYAAPLREELARRAAEASPGFAEAGLVGALEELSRGTDEEPTSALLVRGSSAEGKLVLLDGSPVYAPFHVGGLVSGFDPDLLGGSEFHVGGAPSRFDGGLSYILDLRTRSPRGDRIRTSGAVDGLGARGVVEGGLGGGTRLLAGGRVLHGLQPRLVEGVPSPYAYDDVLLRADTDLGAGHAMTTTAFRNREAVRLDGIREGAGTAEEVAGAPSARWGSGTLSSRYRGLGGRSGVEIGGSLSEYDARLPFGLSQPYLATARQQRARGSVDLSRAWGDGDIRYGFAAERQHVRYAVSPFAVAGEGGPLAGSVAGWLAGGYVEATRPLGAEVVARAGLRADRFSVESGVRVAPRLALTWRLSESADLTLAGGRYHQYQATTGLESEGELLRSSEQRGWRPRLFVSTANHVVLSLEQEFAPGVALELDGFLKRFDAPAPAERDATLHTSGIDVRAYREGSRLDGWFGYGLTWVWSQQGAAPASEFVGRQLLDAGLRGRLTERVGAEVTVSYGAGLPVSSVPLPQTNPGEGPVGASGGIVEPKEEVVRGFLDSQADGAPLLAGGMPDDFLRVDLELDWRATPTFGGRRTELRPYLRVLNALSRRDALFHLLDPWRGEEVRPLAERPLTPVFGLEWRY